jgi:hypothetical protein
MDFGIKNICSGKLKQMKYAKVAQVVLSKNGPSDCEPKDPSVFLEETGESSYQIFNIFCGAVSVICRSASRGLKLISEVSIASGQRPSV